MAKILAQTVGGSTDRQISLVPSNSLNLLLSYHSLSHTQKRKESTVHPSSPVSIVPRCASCTQHCDVWPTDRERKKCDRNQTMLPSLTFSLAFSFFSSLYSHLSFPLLRYRARLDLAAVVVSGRHFVVILHNKGLHANTQLYSCYRHIFPTESAENASLTLPNQQSRGKMTSGDTRFIRMTAKDIANGHRLEFTSANDFEDVTLSSTQREGRFRTIYNPSQV